MTLKLILSINKENFQWKNHAENMQQKPVPDPILTLVNNRKYSLHARIFFENKIFWKRVNFTFLPNPVPINVQCYQKQKEPFRKFQKNSSIGYILSDQIWRCNIKQLLSFFKNYICKFIQDNSWHHELFYLHLSFCIWKSVERKGKKYKNLDTSRTKRAFLMK